MSKESPHLKNQKAGDAGSPAQQNGQPETPPSQSLIVPILTPPRLLGNVVCLLRAARKGRGSSFQSSKPPAGWVGRWKKGGFITLCRFNGVG